tara:strand:+ start:263 stop:2176 length:1914 start_codon:yes stop_codon:yes gene_type:complete
MADIARTILTGGNIGGLLGTTGNRDLRARSLLGLGSGLLAAAGPQPVAPSLGQAMSMGLKEMQQARTAYSNEQLQKMQMEKLKAETEKLLTDEAEEMIWVYDETLEKKIRIAESDYDPEQHRKEAPPKTPDRKTEKDIHGVLRYTDDGEKVFAEDEAPDKVYATAKDVNDELRYTEGPDKGELVFDVEKDEEEVEDIWVYSDEKGYKIRIQPDDFDPEQHRKEAPKEEEEMWVFDKTLNNGKGEFTFIKKKDFNKNTQTKEAPAVDEYALAEKESKIRFPMPSDATDKQKEEIEFLRDTYVADRMGVKGPLEVEEKLLDREMKQIDKQLKEIELQFAETTEILNVEQLELNIDDIKNKIGFDDKANLLKIKKLENQVESIKLNNQALVMENENAPLINQLEIEGTQLDNLKKSIELETFGDHQEELLANMQLKNEKLMNELEWYDTDMQSKIRKRNIEIDKLIYDRDNPPMDYEKIRTESTLRKEFNNIFEVAQMREMKTMYDKVNISAKEDSAAGDISLIFAYMKMLDPRSTVREGEAATVQNARGIPEGIRNMFNKAREGKGLEASQRASFVKASKALMAGTIENYKPVYEAYVDIANRKGFEVEDVVIDYEKMYPKLNISIEATTTLDINPNLQ